MWLIAEYEAVSLFSLKVSAATSSGGKSLLVPTPYALKMALLDAACRVMGAQQAEMLWSQIRDAQMALQPAPKVVVSNLFQRIMKPYRKFPDKDDPEFGTFQRTIGYREYVQLFGNWSLAIELEPKQADVFSNLLVHINYLGKRGSFLQLINIPSLVEVLPANFIQITRQDLAFNALGTLQILDDCAPDVPFARVNIYSTEKLKATDRVNRAIVLPYQNIRSSKSFTLYQYISSE